MEPLAYDAMQTLQNTHWWWRGMNRLYRLALQRCKIESAPLTVIDVGCGYGANLPMLQTETNAHLLVGVDVSHEALASIPRRAGLALVQARADALPFRRASADVIGLLAVVEHVDRDDIVLQETHRISKPDGLQLLLTSAFMLLWSHHDTANEHRRRYRTTQIDQLQHAAGWQILYSSYVNCTIFPLVALVRWVQRKMTPPENALYDMGPNPPILRWILEWLLALEGWLVINGIKLPFGVDLFSVCRRDDNA
jgi:ubiquinone/menaquinone biosynthesis C-methylase UbiE